MKSRIYISVARALTGLFPARQASLPGVHCNSPQIGDVLRHDHYKKVMVGADPPAINPQIIMQVRRSRYAMLPRRKQLSAESRRPLGYP